MAYQYSEERAVPRYLFIFEGLDSYHAGQPSWPWPR